MYAVSGEPPLLGAVQATVAWLSPAVALTAVGAPGLIGVVPAALVNTTVDINQIVFPDVAAPALGVAPADTTWSSTRRSMSVEPLIEAREVKPADAARVLPKPESA